MKQIRIANKESSTHAYGPRYVCEWMEASLMNRWFLKTRLEQALQTHGDGSHWIETREKVQAQELEAA